MKKNETERILRETIEAHPHDVGAIHTLATFMCYVQKDLGEAERLYRRAVEIAPNDAKAIGNLARFLGNNREDHSETERLYRTAHELAPNDASINRGLAGVLQAVGNYDEAEHFYGKAIKLDPHDAMTSHDYAAFLRHVRSDYATAEVFYRKAVSLRPQDEFLNDQLAEFLHHVQRNLEEAGRFYRAALELDPKNPNTIDNYTAALLENGQIAEATEVVERSCQLNEEMISQAGAIAALYQALLCRLNEADDQASLGLLKSYLAVGFKRYSIELKSHMATLSVQLCLEDRELYQALAAAIRDERKVDDLDMIERWRKINPQSLNS